MKLATSLIPTSRKPTTMIHPTKNAGNADSISVWLNQPCSTHL